MHEKDELRQPDHAMRAFTSAHHSHIGWRSWPGACRDISVRRAKRRNFASSRRRRHQVSALGGVGDPPNDSCRRAWLGRPATCQRVAGGQATPRQARCQHQAAEGRVLKAEGGYREDDAVPDGSWRLRVHLKIRNLDAETQRRRENAEKKPLLRCRFASANLCISAPLRRIR